MSDERKKKNSYLRKWRAENREYVRSRDRAYYASNKTTIKERKYKWREENKEKANASVRKWRQNHPNYKKNRRAASIQFRLTENLRARMNAALKNHQKTGSAIQDLGCSIAAFKLYIENQFESDMSWDNYGEWHLDHVMPLASFDLTDRGEFQTAAHYLNYQPLWAEDNLRKGIHV